MPKPDGFLLNIESWECNPVAHQLLMLCEILNSIYTTVWWRGAQWATKVTGVPSNENGRGNDTLFRDDELENVFSFFNLVFICFFFQLNYK